MGIRLGEMFQRIIFKLCVTALACAGPLHAGEPPRNRTKFVEALNRVQEGMSEAAVLGLLGRPDQKIVKEPPDGVAPRGTRHFESWRYGVMGQPPIATLGDIEFDQEREVNSIDGQGKALPEGLFTEEQIRKLIDLLNGVNFNGGAAGHEPGPLIRAVNALQPLGKEKALAAIEEYLRCAGQIRGERVFLVLRTLFEVPAEPGYLPGIYDNGRADRRGPSDPKLLPRFPIALEGEIPFLIAGRVAWEGLGYPTPEQEIPYFRGLALRSKPLHPTTRPFAAIDEFTHSPRWSFKPQRDFAGAQVALLPGELDTQAARLLGSVVRYEEDPCGCSPQADVGTAGRVRRRAELSKLQIRWDANHCRYTFADGTTLPEIRREKFSWKPPLPGRSVAFTVQRTNPTCIEMGLNETWQSGATPVTNVKVYVVSVKQKPLYDFGLFGGWKWVNLCLKEGTEIQAEFKFGETIQRSPVFKP
jgi:hypothetical protein